MAESLRLTIFVEVLGYNEEPGEVCKYETTGVIPFPGSVIQLSGPKRNLTSFLDSKPNFFIAQAKSENYTFQLETGIVEIHLQDNEAMNKDKRVSSIVKEYLKHGWSKL